MTTSKSDNVKKVMRFTLAQHYKALSVRILLVVLAVLGFASIPLLKLMFANESEVAETAVTQIYVRNDTSFPFDIAEFKSDERFSTVEMVETETSDESFRQLLSENPTSAALTLQMGESGMGVEIHVLYSENSTLQSDEFYTIRSVAEDALHQSLLHSLAVSDEQLEIVNAGTFSQVQSLSAYETDTAETGVDTHAMMNFGYSYFILILAVMAMSYIFALCIEEKNTKLIEFLLVNVEPTALLVGKILAVTVFILVGLGVLIGSFLISYFFMKSQGSVEFLNDILKATGIWDVFHSIHAADLILTIIGVALGYTILALLSGIFGSLCSKTEDSQQATLGVVAVIMIGYFAASFSPMFESDAVNIVLSLFPLTSIFVAPANYVCGKISLGILLFAFVLQIVFILYLTKLLGRVYRMMVLYRGQVPTPLRLIKMLRETRNNEKGGDSHAA